MKDISYTKQRLALLYAKKYNKEPHDPLIDTLAEIQALLRVVIPHPYWKYSIKEFNGKLKGDAKATLLSPDVAFKAKEKIAEYCWKDVDLKEDIYDDNLMLNKSIMHKRLKEGRNVIIYAPEAKTVVTNKAGNQQVEIKSQKGRTMVASLIIKEAIKMRYKSGHRVQSHDWIEYPVLKNMLIENDPEANLQKACDWLVVDDISLESTPSGRSYISGVIDPFFISRLKDGLPTIFVFRFDLNKELPNIEKGLGVAIHRIVNDPKTHVISLGE